MIDAEHVEVSQKLAKFWDIDIKKVDEMESNFMDAINGIITDFSMDTDGKKMRSCYDADVILSNISNAIKEYQEVFHIIRTTLYWKEKK